MTPRRGRRGGPLVLLLSLDKRFLDLERSELGRDLANALFNRDALHAGGADETMDWSMF